MTVTGGTEPMNGHGPPPGPSAAWLMDRVDALALLRQEVYLGPEPEATERQHRRGKLTARERIERLCDPGSFHELEMLRRHRSSGFGLEKRRPHTDGVITGWGTVDGRKVFLYAHDFRIFGGSLGEAHAEKIHKVMDLAESVGAPLIGLNDGAGARIQEGVTALAGYGGIFRRNVRASGVIPQISVMLGPCAGGASYSPALTDFVFMVRGMSENADFAEAVLDAGLTWIGPPPAAMRALGDKLAAREVAARVGAPMVAGSPEALDDPGAVVAFAREAGLPVAIKAAYGGGGRGLKVARALEEIPELFASATREATAAFGRGECFVERYLDRPRHVETQCLADSHGNVVVVSTRDCTLQRRHQKLVEEAPAPFLTPEQTARLYAASKAILREAAYVGAGTCEFLVGAGGDISFLEVNARLQVEHPVSEEVTGLDLVREQLRIAAGEELGYDDPPVRGHAIEFRINAEDPGRGFLPQPGVVTRWEPPGGPGVRVDSGATEGTVIAPEFDSMLAKLIVTGRDRSHALERARRALEEFEVGGLATVLPFHRAVVSEPAFTDEPFAVYTRWIEEEFAGRIPAQIVPDADEPPAPPAPPARERLTVEVDGRRVEVVVPELVTAAAPPAVARRAPRRAPSRTTTLIAPSGDALVSPMQGSVVKIAVTEGQRVEEGELVMIMEAMKMEQQVCAHRAGTVAELAPAVGDTLAAGALVCRILD